LALIAPGVDPAKNVLHRVVGDVIVAFASTAASALRGDALVF
jgi:hypothetical protein